MTEDEKREAMVAGWNACRKSIFAVCEDVEREADEAARNSRSADGYAGGLRRAAKSIARGFGAMEATDDDNFTAAMKAES